MAITQAPTLNVSSQGPIGCNFIHLGSSLWVFHAAAAPTDGTSGDGAGWAGPGSLYVDRTASTGMVYVNTGTKASPTWTKVGTQS